jgi:hypothetical protein
LQYNRIETVLVGFFVAFQQLLRNEVWVLHFHGDADVDCWIVVRFQLFGWSRPQCGLYENLLASIRINLVNARRSATAGKMSKASITLHFVSSKRRELFTQRYNVTF